FQFVGKNGSVYDCPTEKVEVYATGTRDRLVPAPQLVGQALNGEIKLLSGIAAVNVHWEPGGAQPPFGRPYENNVCRATKVEKASRLLLFGDGHSDVRL